MANIKWLSKSLNECVARVKLNVCYPIMKNNNYYKIGAAGGKECSKLEMHDLEAIAAKQLPIIGSQF